MAARLIKSSGPGPSLPELDRLPARQRSGCAHQKRVTAQLHRDVGAAVPGNKNLARSSIVVIYAFANWLFPEEPALALLNDRRNITPTL